MCSVLLTPNKASSCPHTGCKHHQLLHPPLSLLLQPCSFHNGFPMGVLLLPRARGVWLGAMLPMENWYPRRPCPMAEDGSSSSTSKARSPSTKGSQRTLLLQPTRKQRGTQPMGSSPWVQTKRCCDPGKLRTSSQRRAPRPGSLDAGAHEPTIWGSRGGPGKLLGFALEETVKRKEEVEPPPPPETPGDTKPGVSFGARRETAFSRLPSTREGGQGGKGMLQDRSPFSLPLCHPGQVQLSSRGPSTQPVASCTEHLNRWL